MAYYILSVKSQLSINLKVPFNAALKKTVIVYEYIFFVSFRYIDVK